MEDGYISLNDILMTIKNGWKIIVGTCLIVALMVFIITKFFVIPQYRADVKLFIGKNSDESSEYSNNDVTMYQKLMVTYSEIVYSYDLINEAIEDSGYSLSEELVRDSLNVSVGDNTQVLKVSYNDFQQKVALDLLDEIVEEFVYQSEKLIPNVSVTVLESSRVSDDPVSPNTMLMTVVGFVVGLMGSVFYLLIMDYLRNTVKSEDKLTEILEMPVLVSLPHLKNTNCTVSNSPTSPWSERFRILRTNIEYSSFDNNIKTIIVTSSNPNEGKTSIATNLALAFHEDGKRVLLVDADLRKPSVHKKLNISNTLGLTDVIAKKMNFEEVVIGYMKNLEILTAGTITPNPSKLIGSDSMKIFIDIVRESYDIVIFDTPPLNAVTDGQILSALVDGTLFVVKADYTKQDQISNAHKLLKRVKGNMIGSIFNDVNNGGDDYSYGESCEKTRYQGLEILKKLIGGK